MLSRLEAEEGDMWQEMCISAFELSFRALGCDEAFEGTPLHQSQVGVPDLSSPAALCAELLLELQSRCARHRF